MRVNKILTHISQVVFSPVLRKLEAIQRNLDDLKLLLGRDLVYRISHHCEPTTLRDVEFRVFSQFGDDGIIQYLINNIDISKKKFIEFGVDNYLESNTRFLLLNDNWAGLVLDCSEANVDLIRNDPIYWKHDLKAVCAFVNKDNINGLFVENDYSGEIGILSIDIDGIDYWIWDAINVVSPVIVIMEYNSAWGPNHAITVPYDPNFSRTSAHYSNLYWGCSLRALELLGLKKGYVFVGSNSNGNNAYFVRKDRIANLKPQDASTGYVESMYRESRNSSGQLTYLSGSDRLEAIADMEVYDVVADRVKAIRDL